VLPRILESAFFLACVFTGCAYFNTFYNARSHFAKAERIQAGRTLGDDSVAGSAVTEYDLAIEKCNKVIQHHSDSRWVDDAILLMGRSYFGKHQYSDALDKFRALADSPASDLREAATYWLGATYYELGRPEEGRQTFERLLVEFPHSPRRAEALRVQAESLVRENRVAEALTAYRRILGEFPDASDRAENLFAIGELYMQAGFFDSAYAAYDEVARTAGEFDIRLEARVLRGDALFREKRHAEALETYRTALDVGRSLPAEEKVVIELKAASCRVELGEYERAISEYEAIAETYQSSVHAAEALFKIGFIQEARYGNYTAALASYQKIKELPAASMRSVFAADADRRARELKRLVDAGLTSPAQGGDAEASGAFLLAEQFLFQETDTAKAIAQYATVEERFPGSEEAARAAFARAWLADIARAGEDSVNAQYLRVVRSYPGTEQAVGAGEILIARGLGDLVPREAMTLSVKPPKSETSPADSMARQEAPEMPENDDEDAPPLPGDPRELLRSRLRGDRGLDPRAGERGSEAAFDSLFLRDTANVAAPEPEEGS